MGNFAIFFGIVFALFLPGFFLSLLLFKKMSFLERVVLSVLFSIIITTTLTIVLGFDEAAKERTGGVTPQNVWKWEIIITSAFALLAGLRFFLDKDWHQRKIREISHFVKKLRTPLKEGKVYRRL